MFSNIAKNFFLRFVHCSGLVEIPKYSEYMGKRSLTIFQKEVESISNKTVLYDTSCKHCVHFSKIINKINNFFVLVNKYSEYILVSYCSIKSLFHFLTCVDENENKFDI